MFYFTNCLRRRKIKMKLNSFADHLLCYYWVELYPFLRKKRVGELQSYVFQVLHGFTSFVTDHSSSTIFFSFRALKTYPIQLVLQTTFEPPVATISCKRLFLVSGQFSSKYQKFSSEITIFRTSRKWPRQLLELKV